MTRFRDPSLQALEARCNEEALRFCQVLFPENGYVAGNEFVVGSIRGDRGDSLMVNLVTGVWMDFAASQYRGNILNLVFYARGQENWGRTFKEARAILRLPDWAPSKPNSVIVSNEDKKKKAAEVWGLHRQFTGTPVQTYFDSRGLVGASRLKNLGYVPNCFWRWFEKEHGRVGSKTEGIKHEGKAPAAVARLVDVHNAFQAIHRIYLTADGQKAALPDPKMGLGMQHGAACRLQGDDFRVIFASEGIEDGMAVALSASCLTVWATPSGTMLGNIQVPAETRVLLSGGDNDHEGEWAFQRQCARFAERPGLKVVRANPVHHDWNRDLEIMGPEAVKDRLRQIYREAMNAAEQAGG